MSGFYDMFMFDCLKNGQSSKVVVPFCLPLSSLGDL